MIDDKVFDLDITDIELGTVASLVWLVEAEEITAFAELSGDRNPLHVDGEYARSVGYQGEVAHGMLLGAKFSGLFGMKLPGKRCLLLEHTLAYPNPVYAGDQIALKVEVRDVHSELGIVELKATAENLSDSGDPGPQVARGKVTCKILS